MEAGSRARADSTVNDIAAPSLRAEAAEALERLSRRLVTRPLRPDGAGNAGTAADLTRVQDTVRLLGQVVAAWQDIPDNALPEDSAGFGSTVVVEDVDRGRRETYTLMTGALLDIDGGQVSLASPIGRALLGTAAGAVVNVDTPQRRRRLRVLSVTTLRDRLQDWARAP